MPHFDAKGAADELFRRRGVPLTRLAPSLFWEHLAPFGVLPQRDAGGRLVLPLPMGERPLPGMSVADIGPIVRAVFTDPQRWLGRRLGVAAAHLDGAQMAAALARALGEPVLHLSPRFADVAARPLPGAAGIANMFQFLHDFNEEVLAMRPLAAARALHPGLLGFGAWLTLNVDGLPVQRRVAAYEAGLLVH
ncbi:MAG: NmrA family NAD(P)-binding protein [Rubrivivax sp.]